MLTLKDLQPRVVNISIVRGQLPGLNAGDAPIEDVVVVPMLVPSWVEWNELGMEVPTPEPEMVRVIKNGKPVFEKESGPAYEAKIVLANNQRTLRRLTFALIEAGNFPELKLMAAAEQMIAVSALDAGMLNALARVLNTLVQMTMGRISDKVERFQPGQLSANGHGGVFTSPLDADELEATSRE